MLLFEELHVDICSSDSSFLLWFLLSLFALALILAMVSCYLWSKCYRYHRRRMCGLPCFSNYWTLECVKGLWHWISLFGLYAIGISRRQFGDRVPVVYNWVELSVGLSKLMRCLLRLWIITFVLTLLINLSYDFSVFAFVYCFDIRAPLFKTDFKEAQNKRA